MVYQVKNLLGKDWHFDQVPSLFLLLFDRRSVMRSVVMNEYPLFFVFVVLNLRKLGRKVVWIHGDGLHFGVAMTAHQMWAWVDDQSKDLRERWESVKATTLQLPSA